MKTTNLKKTVLLLSGGKDSLHALGILLSQDYEVFALCMSGKEKSEEAGAKKAALEYGVPLKVVQANWFSETTWNPLKLIYRDLGMGFIAMRHAKRLGATTISCGVKPSDFEALPWLNLFLKIGNLILKLFGIQLIFPLKEGGIA